jgi:hypothetical protein
MEKGPRAASRCDLILFMAARFLPASISAAAAALWLATRRESALPPSSCAESPARAPSIALADKQQPLIRRVCSVHGDRTGAARPPLVAPLGTVNVSALRAAVEEHGAALWASDFGVRVKRYGHDAWGVGKAVFLYCDDELEETLVFPLRTHEPWRTVLSSVFEELDVPEACVVRCLLAKLPPGATIPPHYDTGEWVGRVHRVHVPIIVDEPDSIDFLVGYGDEAPPNSAQKRVRAQAQECVETSVVCAAVDAFRCAPPSRRSSEGLVRLELRAGEAFELNNRCVHSVSNRGQTDRVHLIFDYVAPQPAGDGQPGKASSASAARSAAAHAAARAAPPVRTVLGAGDVLVQTRRTIERVAAPPFFVIIGAQKAGTTWLWDHISAHPDVERRARRKEPHFFDWRWPSAAALLPNRRQLRSRIGARAGWGALDDVDALAMAGAVRDAQQSGAVRDAWCAQWRGGLHAAALDALRVAYGACFARCAALAAAAEAHAPLCYGEATPSYLLGGSTVAARLRAVVPNARLIVVLRDPVARAQSHWAMMSDATGSSAQRAHRGSESAIARGGFARAVDDDIARIDALGFAEYCRAAATESANGAGGIVARGLYAAQLKEWLAWWPKSSILVLRLEDLDTVDGVQRAMDRVCAHLGLAPIVAQPGDVKAHNARSYDTSGASAEAVRSVLAEFYRVPESELGELLAQPGWAEAVQERG